MTDNIIPFNKKKTTNKEDEGKLFIFVCDVCENTEGHILFDHEADDTVFECNECGIETSLQDILNANIIIKKDDQEIIEIDLD